MANGERMETVTDFISLDSKITADGNCSHDIKRCFLLRTEAMRNLDSIFPCSSVGEESACNAGDPGSIPGLGRSSGEGNGNPCQYSCLENLMDRGAWQTTVHRIARVGHDLVYCTQRTDPSVFPSYVSPLERR